MTELTVHYWNFGCDHKSACGLWEYVDGEKVNPLDDSIENVTCENCKRAYTRRYIDSREACLGIDPYAVRPSMIELLDRAKDRYGGKVL